MALNLPKRTRIVLLFLLGIALPSLLFHSGGSIPSLGLSSSDPSVVWMLQQGQQIEFQKKVTRRHLLSIDRLCRGSLILSSAVMGNLFCMLRSEDRGGSFRGRRTALFMQEVIIKRLVSNQNLNALCNNQ
jgi:hypothetical protein